MPGVLVLLAAGAEEMETTIVVDVLRRAEIGVVLAGIAGVAPVTCSRQVRICPDVALDAAKADYDAVVLPGGAGGARQLAESADVGTVLNAHWEREKIIAAICAAPIALLRHRIGLGKRLTSHPSVRAELANDYQLSDERVVEDGRLLSSQGPGTSFEFALALVSRLRGADVAARVRAPLML